MQRRHFLHTAALLGATPLTGFNPAKTTGALAKTPALTPDEIAAIESALGKKGTYIEAQATHTTALPRNDLKIKVKGDPVPIPFGFGGWVSLKKTVDGKQTVLMSDTVLLEAEVNPLITAAQANGLEIGAIHNHFFYEEPRIFYMHLHGLGTPAELAQKYAAAIRDTKLFPANQPPAPAPPAKTGKELFDLPALDGIVKAKGVVNGPTYKYTIGRDDLTVTDMGAEMTAAIGLNTWASFAGTAEQAHIAGDVAMLEGEVNGVIKALRQNNIEVVALHHHMLGEQPRIIFLHYYGRGPATTLAQGFRAALDQLGKNNGLSMPMKH